jgi:hypothetical protein
MLLTKKNIPTLLLLLITLNSFAQKKGSSKKSGSDFKIEDAQRALLTELNKIRIENQLDTVEYNEMLGKASEIQATDMATLGKADLENSKGKYKTTEKRVIAVGGTNKAEELVLSTGIVKGKASMSAQEFAESVFYKWRTGKRQQAIIKNPNYIYASPSVSLDENGKKAYVSIVFGSFNTFNSGADKKKELTVPFTSKNKKLKAPEERTCNACKKFKDYDGLANGLYVEDGKIFIKYDDLKSLSKFIRNSKDGLAVDVIQRAQFDNPDYNILDNNLQSKGILLKTVTKSKIYSKNRIPTIKKGNRKIKPKKLDVQLGVLPPKISDDYELNLLVVQDGKLCKTIAKSKVEQGDQESNTPLMMLLMPDSAAYIPSAFQPKAETAILSFNIPFQKNKSDYKEEDLQPFLNALQEPDFLIEGLYITAFSSIEGNASDNEKLQKKRAESIIKALSKIQKNNVSTNVKTSDSWELFKLEMEGSKYDNLTQMTKEEAIKEINSKGLANELEPYLAKERFAQIVMDITYDISGDKEEKFSIAKFNQAVKKGDLELASKIQYYISTQIRNKKYSEAAASKMIIPYEIKYSGLLNNQVVLNYVKNNYVADDSDCVKLKKIASVDPSNNYVEFNNLFCKVTVDSTIGDSKNQSETQKRIDALYKTNIPKKYVDALNIEWQFKIIEAMDTVEGGQLIINACVEKIKSFYNVKDATWQNNLKLSYVFARFKDYKYASNLLLPFVKESKPNEQLIFAYVSYCAKMPELYKSRPFIDAMKKAEKLNHDRYCKLFGAPNLTFQILENPIVKADYFKAKCK